MGNDNDNNIFSLVSNTTNEPKKQTIPNFDYVIVDINGEEHYASGFLLFTSQHVAVMRELPEGALPIFVMPLDKVYLAELIEEDIEEQEELPL